MASDRERFLGFERVVRRADREVVRRLDWWHELHNGLVEAPIIAAEFPATPDREKRAGEETISVAIGTGMIVLATRDEQPCRLRLIARHTA